jgi:putative membrane protein
MQLLLRWIISAVALYLTALTGHALGLAIWIEPGSKAIVPALTTALALGIVNAILRPILKLLALPITCLTLGLFSFVINAFLFWLVGQFAHGFHVRGFAASLFGAVVMSVISGLLNNVLISHKEKNKA